MKRKIFALLRYLGWKKFKKISNQKVESALPNTNALLNTWVKGALHAINDELGKQLSKNGFEPDMLRAGVFVLTCEITEDMLDPSIKHQTYRVGTIEILRVTWKLNGFSIHVREHADAKGIKKSIAKALKQTGISVNSPIIVTGQTAEDIKLTNQARKMVDDFEKSPAPKLHVSK